MKKLMVNYFQTRPLIYTRIVLALAAVNVSEVCSSDVRQAILQSEQQIVRSVYIRNEPHEF